MSTHYPVSVYKIYVSDEIAHQTIDFDEFCSFLRSIMGMNDNVTVSKGQQFLNVSHYEWCGKCIQVECKRHDLWYVECYRRNKGLCYGD